MSLNLFAYGDEDVESAPKQVETTGFKVNETKVEKVKEESISKEKEAKIEKSSEVKIQEEKLVSKASKSNSDSVPREAPPVPKEDESAYWTAVFDKNTGHYYYWNRKTNVTTWTCPEFIH
ncbi:uncharacterized protein [Blastocystis hominis]|uniref:WW domain-containing protein n=1 Tax=Blastocystis hominis TaxID=12968 RepID=D8M149_BLAHO|nr:uncharacterized protein [Blastocystis hominis]CBK21788.2 unnamed protein product [Blastocystis hominis]|eukprot:XP_012895836.1 uncharacterized protein [Blastocystis hominis]